MGTLTIARRRRVADPPLAANRRDHRRMVGWLRAVTAPSIHSGSIHDFIGAISAVIWTHGVATLQLGGDRPVNIGL
ncbi:MAG: hypothetical protein WB870_01145 [Gallionellaceae bacterium]